MDFQAIPADTGEERAPRPVERDHRPSAEQVGTQSAALSMVPAGVRAGKRLWAAGGGSVVPPSCLCHTWMLWGRLSLRNLRTV